MMLYLSAMLITAVVETVLLLFFKYRGWKVLAYFFVLNLISNFLVNFTYRYTYYMLPKIVLIPMLELGVYVFEIGLLGLMTGYNKKLFLCVFLTNLFSYSLGVLLYGV